MNVMQRAHQLAKQGVNRFGGKHADYFSEALKIAYREQKALVSVVEEKPSVIVFICFIVLTIVLSPFSVKAVESVKLINPDVSINFIDVPNKLKEFKINH